MVEIREVSDFEALLITQNNALKEILRQQKEAKIGEGKLFEIVGLDQNFTNYGEFESSFPQNIEQCRCELPWRDYLQHIYCPCHDTIEKVERYKNIMLAVVERGKTIFENYKNGVITQIERELREKLPSNATEIENADWWRNWREEIRSQDNREKIEHFKNTLLGLAERIKVVKDEYEEWKRQDQQRQEGWEEKEREFQKKMEKDALETGKRAQEEAEKWCQEQQKEIKKIEEIMQKLTQEAKKRQKNRQEKSQEEVKGEKKETDADKLSQEVEDNLKKNWWIKFV
jgi:hypothetical protein